MGKEKAGATLSGLNSKKERIFIDKALLQKDAAKQWSLSQGIVYQSDITEDGVVLVTIKSQNSDNDVICSGISNEGNTQANLVQTLKRKNLIPKNSKTQTMYLFKNLVWNLLNPTTDTFNSGERLMLVIESKKTETKRAIKHI